MPAIEGVGVAERAIAPLTLDNAPKITPKTVDNSGGGQAAVIVSLSSAATSAAVGSNLGEISANKVVNVLSSAVGANGFAENYRRFDFSRIEKYSVRQLQIATGMNPFSGSLVWASRTLFSFGPWYSRSKFDQS